MTAGLSGSNGLNIFTPLENIKENSCILTWNYTENAEKWEYIYIIFSCNEAWWAIIIKNL